MVRMNSGLELMRRLAISGIIAGCLIAGEALAQAQVPANPAPPGTPEALPEKVEPGPPATVPDTHQESGDKLAPAGIVIEPPKGVDPGLVKLPPDNGAAKTPVIQPVNPPSPTVLP